MVVSAGAEVDYLQESILVYLVCGADLGNGLVAKAQRQTKATQYQDDSALVADQIAHTIGRCIGCQ